MLGGYQLRLFVTRLMRARGFQIIRAPDLGDFLRTRQCDLVVDVGANRGQFGLEARRLGYAGRLISFEPVADCFDELSGRALHDDNWEVRREAVGNEAGTVDINVSENRVYSSIQPLADLGAIFDKETAVVRVETVPLTTLDIALKDDPAQAVFLKVDTQGFEKAVLSGAAETLRRCSGLLLELPVGNLYLGVWSFAEAATYIESLGFEMAQMLPVSFRPGDPASALEFDCIFRRKD